MPGFRPVDTKQSFPELEERVLARWQERDVFRYRITRTVNGKNETVEAPESAVPPALQACVSDKLK